MSSSPQQPGAEASPDGQLALEDPVELARLRRDLFSSLGPERACYVLFGVGFCEGMAEGLRVMRAFGSTTAGRVDVAARSAPMVFRPESGALHSSFGGSLARSIEASLHLRDYAPAHDPVCYVSSGFAAGWYSAILGETILAQETSCIARGDERCHFEARRLQDLMDDADPWTLELLPYLDLEAIQTRAEEKSLDPDDAEKQGDMMGSFDPMSPAIHVWGPVMVLPYSGPDDGLTALDAIREDVGHDQIRVVVIDVTGAVIDPIEAVGLTRLLDALDSNAIETVMVGMGERGARYFRARANELGPPLLARNISEGIALGFQLSQSSFAPR